jgi:hypothetical protein
MGTLGSNDRAIYVSENKGKGFTKLTDYNKYTLAKSGSLFASRNRFGRVYLASGGLGWLYMDTAEEGYIPTEDTAAASRPLSGWAIAGIAVGAAILGTALFFIFKKKRSK